MYLNTNEKNHYFSRLTYQSHVHFILYFEMANFVSIRMQNIE